MKNQLCFQKVGEGDPLILLHGFTGDASTMMPLGLSLSENRTVYSIDLPGHGETGVLEDSSLYGFEETIDLLRAFVVDAELNQVDLLGYSMGGRIALGFTIRYPELAKKLVLISSSAGLTTQSEREVRRRVDGDLAHQILEEGIEVFVDSWMQQPLFESQQRLDPTIIEKQRQQRLKNSPEGLAASLQGVGTGSQPSLWNHLESITAETLLVVGEDDSKFRRLAMKMASGIQKSVIAVIDDAGHATHLENLSDTAEVVRSFLSSSE